MTPRVRASSTSSGSLPSGVLSVSASALRGSLLVSLPLQAGLGGARPAASADGQPKTAITPLAKTASSPATSATMNATNTMTTIV